MAETIEMSISDLFRWVRAGVARGNTEEALAVLDDGIRQAEAWEDREGDLHRAAPRMLAALREAEAGLEFAVARLDAAGKDWDMAAERQALGIVRAAITEAEGRDG